MSDPQTASSAQPTSEIEAEVAAGRELRQRLESEVPPLARSLDGRRFQFQAPWIMELQVGGYVQLQRGDRTTLGQIIDQRLDRQERTEVAAAIPGAWNGMYHARVGVNLIAGEGLVLDGDGPFHDADLAPAECSGRRVSRRGAGAASAPGGRRSALRARRRRHARRRRRQPPHSSVRAVRLREVLRARGGAGGAPARDGPADRRSGPQLRLRRSRGGAARRPVRHGCKVAGRGGADSRPKCDRDPRGSSEPAVLRARDVAPGRSRWARPDRRPRGVRSVLSTSSNARRAASHSTNCSR